MADLLSRLKAALADRYRVERELGAGGMATVYLAEDLKHHRSVAIKVLRPDLAATLGPERFHREIRIAANLTHPHILPLHDSGDAEGFLYYVMPHVEGESLRDRLARGGELPIPEAIRILRDVVDALSAAHEKGVIHRDIKPDNVMLTRHHALVTDFGVAKAVSEATGVHEFTTEGVTLGTPAYMSPEQAAAEKDVDHRADIYAVGALAYELLTGRPPFTGATLQEVIAAQLTQAPEPVTQHRSMTPPALANVVMRCLEKKPADRWQSAEELLSQLEALGSPSAGLTPAGTIPPSQGGKSRWKTLRGVAVVAAAITLIGIVLLSRWWNPTGSDRDRVLVVAFADQSGREETAMIGRMAQDYIIQALTEAGFAEVVDPLAALAVSQDVVASGVAAPMDILSLAAEARAGTVVSGSYYAEADSVLVQTWISSARDGKVLRTVGPVVGSLSARGELVAHLGKEVVGALAAVFNRDLLAWEPAVQPAAYEAYEAYDAGLEAYLRDEWGKAGPLFERAAAIDPSFSRAMLWAAQSYLIVENHAKAESLTTILVSVRGELTRFERCRLDLVIALSRPASAHHGYDAARCMAQAAPGSDDAKREVALFALRLNRPGEAVKILRGLDPDHGLMARWSGYWDFLARTYHLLEDYEAEFEVARQGPLRFPDHLDSHWEVVRALAALGRADEVRAHFATIPALGPWGRMEYEIMAADELRVHGRRSAALQFLAESIELARSGLPETDGSRFYLMLFLYHAERWDEALSLCQELDKKYPQITSILGMLGKLAARLGDREEALRVSEALRRVSSGSVGVTLERARIAALLGDREEAMTLLEEAVDQGILLFGLREETALHRDMDLEGLSDYPPFREFMRPKG